MAIKSDLTQLQTNLDRLTLALEQNTASLSRTRRQLHVMAALLMLTIGIALFIGLHGPDPAYAESEVKQTVETKIDTLKENTSEHLKKAEADAKTNFNQLIDKIRLDAQKTGKIDPASAITVFLRDMSEALKSMPKMAKDMDQMAQDMAEMNNKMSAVPVMAAEMQHMNALMGVMAHSVDSTMGRMGNWMPWGP